MKRGPEPTKGYEAAIPAALRRGRVMHFRSSPAYVSNFMVYGNGLLVLVCLRLAKRLSHATIAEIRADYADAIAGLCTLPCGGPVSRELWLYSRHGALRFFRIQEDGSLEKIDRDGAVFVNGKPAGTLLAAYDNAGSPARMPAASVPAGSGSIDTRSPIIRWLTKRNAMKKSGTEGTGTTCAGNPEKIPDTGHQGPAVDMEVPAHAPVSSPDTTTATVVPEGVPAAGSIPGEQRPSPATEEEGGRPEG